MTAATVGRFEAARLYRTDIDPDRVLAAAHRFDRTHHNPHLSVTVSDPDDLDPLICVAEHERRVETTLLDLTAALNNRGIPDADDAVIDGFAEWVDERPVCDEAAELYGVAAVGWADGEHRVRWRVLVPRRGGFCAEWVPTLRTGTDRVHRTRHNAIARAQALAVTPLRSGEVTVWAHFDNPALSSAVLAGPEKLTDAATDAYVVFTPGRPVAVAARIPALRLAEECSEPHLIKPVTDLSSIGWT